ncbi:ML3 [Symbiodinium natans]|uniref:ML3 protein n=1 Tax=Symbiodinium natans TaxID=878477 RepID=A0A812TR65_9DINO|nr:ML3 [Symbiodinium natans]
MLRNVPNRYTCEELLAEIMNAGFDHMFDFFYLPIDFTTKRNRGYGFINFHSSAEAEEFALAFHHRRLNRYPTSKILEVAPAKTQGYQANMSKYFKKPGSARVKNAYFKPMLFTEDAELTD